LNNIKEFRSADLGKFLLESRLIASGKEKFMIHRTRKSVGQSIRGVVVFAATMSVTAHFNEQ
jgi:hypothetical protein